MTHLKMLYSTNRGERFITLDTRGGRGQTGAVNGRMAAPPPHKHPAVSWTGNLDPKDPKHMHPIGIKCPEVWDERKESAAAPGPQGRWERGVCGGPGRMCRWQLPSH